MIIIFIAETEHYKEWIGKTYYDILIHYLNNSNNEISVVYTTDYKNYNKSWFTNKNPDIVVFLDTDSLRFADLFSYVFELNCKIFASSLDFFSIIDEYPMI